MALEKVMIPRVWADEIFYGATEIAVPNIVPPAGVTLTADTTIVGTATVAVADCRIAGNIVTVDYIIQEELTVVTPGEDSFPLEYTFRFSNTYQFRKFTVPAEVIPNLYCEVFRFTGTVTIDDISVNLVTGTLSFVNNVAVQTKLKALENIQTFVALGTPPNVVTSPIIVVTPV